MLFEIIQAREIMMLWPVVFGDEIAGTQVNVSEVRRRILGRVYLISRFSLLVGMQLPQRAVIIASFACLVKS